MTMLEVLIRRREEFAKIISKPYTSKEEIISLQARINEINNLIFIISTQNITEVK